MDQIVELVKNVTSLQEREQKNVSDIAGIIKELDEFKARNESTIARIHERSDKRDEKISEIRSEVERWNNQAKIWVIVLVAGIGIIQTVGGYLFNLMNEKLTALEVNNTEVNASIQDIEMNIRDIIRKLNERK
jgi:DNA repair exonuclease SbcCD ATPase subunit